MSGVDPQGSPVFPSTRWSMVVAAASGGSPPARAALESLCETYWYPLYAFARRTGSSPDAAQDAVQGFFAALLDKHALERADPQRGRFRAFLLSAFQNFVRNERERALTQKRGGGRVLSLEVDDAERRFLREPTHEETAERVYLREWATALLRGVLADLGRSYEAKGQLRVFSLLREFLDGRPAERRLGDAARELGLTEGATRVALHRLRQRYGEALRQAVADTLVDPQLELEQELRELAEILGGGR